MDERGTGVTTIFKKCYGYDLTIGEAREALAQTRLIGTPHELTALSLTNLFLERIERYQPELHALVEVLAETALGEAAVSDAKRKNGVELGKLQGIPIAIKDIIDVA